MTNSRAKGVKGEKQATYLLRDLGYKARRSSQNSGVADDEHSADILTNIPGIRFEVWRTTNKKHHLWSKALQRKIEQAKAEAGEGYDWVVLWKEDYGDWTAVCDLGGVLVRTTDIGEVIDIKSVEGGPVNWPGE